MRNGKFLSDQLSFLPEKMVDEALESCNKLQQKNTAIRMLRIAACFAVIVGLLFGFPAIPFPDTDVVPGTNIVTGMGILSVTVYAINAETNAIVQEELEAGIEINNTHYWPLVMNSYPGLPVFLSVATEDFPEDSITYEICVDYGEYLDWGNTGYSINHMGKAFSMPNDVGIYWSLRGDDFSLWETDELDVVYTTITILCEDHIVGYALLRFDRAYGRDVLAAYPGADYWIGNEDQPAHAYWSNLIASVSFPKVDGQYQNVSQEYVDDCIENIINSL